MSNAAPLVRWDGLAKTFGRKTLFREVSGHLSDGNVLAVCGPNGSGKSTLLRILAGVMRPSAGRVQWDPTLPEADGRVGFAAPYLQLYHELSAAENLHFFSRLAGTPLSRAEIGERLLEVGLAREHHDKRLGSFSSGMIQRARLAWAVLARPKVLFLDEPGTNLDEAGRGVVRGVVATQRGRGAAILATNDPEEAALADATLTLV